MSDVLKDACGVFGIFGHPEASRLTYLGLYAQQHRGQESAGIVSAQDGRILSHIGMGLVNDVFNVERLDYLKGDRAIGHVRYSTAGGSQLRNAQPLLCDTNRGSVAVAHNGNLTNARALRERLERAGSIFASKSDSEAILHLLARSYRPDFDEALMDICRIIHGAYSLLIFTPEAIYACRDPHGIRPLCIGRLGDAYIACSETCALDIIDAEYVREVEPGEIVKFDASGMTSLPFTTDTHCKHCIFEYIYFARPDSRIFGDEVERVRKQIGRTLAELCPAEADVVVPIPDSSVIAAIGYAEQSGIPYELGIIRNHYIGRTFIEPAQRIRDFGAKLKYNVVRSVVEGQRVVVIDDSIVRGTTMRKLIVMLRDKGGAKEIHLRISSPPITHPCYYGIDTPTREELIAATHELEEIRAHLGVDTLAYLPLEGLRKSVDSRPDDFCYGCFSGCYPIPIEDDHPVPIAIPQPTLFDDMVEEERERNRSSNGG